MSSSTFTSRTSQRNQPAAIPTPTRSANTVRVEAPQNTGSVSGPVAAHPSAEMKAPADKNVKPTNKSAPQSPRQATVPGKPSTSDGQAAPQANQPAGQATSQPASTDKQTPGNQSTQSDKQSPPKEGNERDVVFELDDQNAQDIRLVGCFTEWDKSPIALRKINSKRWQTKVRLAPGRYQYRFLVDGEWRDDPHAAVRHPNPYGTFDAIREIS